MWRLLSAALALGLLPISASLAQSSPTEDADLQFIPDSLAVPPSVEDSPPGKRQTDGDGVRANAPPSHNSWIKSSVEVAPRATGWRTSSVPLQGTSQPDWSLRSSFWLDLWARLTPELTATVSNRLDHSAKQGRSINGDDFSNSLKEAFVSWTPSPDLFFDIGRVNLKNGVASGFNPTDFFKSYAVINRISDDTAALRDARVGTVMVRGQKVWTGGSFMLALAPDLGGAAPPPRDRSFDPGLDRTNAAPSAFAKTTLKLTEDISPSFSVYAGEERVKFGADITHVFTNRIVGYAEWSGGRRGEVEAEMLRHREKTGEFPKGLTPLIGGTDEAFRSQAALGFSLSPSDKDITLTFEYHFNEAGFDAKDWDRWFALGQSTPGFAGRLWSIRQGAGEAGEPISQHSLFLRASWNDAMIDNFDLAALAFIDAQDGSAFVQADGTFHLSDHASLGLTTGANLGPSRSVYGSTVDSHFIEGKVRWYF